MIHTIWGILNPGIDLFIHYSSSSPCSKKPGRYINTVARKKEEKKSIISKERNFLFIMPSLYFGGRALFAVHVFPLEPLSTHLQIMLGPPRAENP